MKTFILYPPNPYKRNPKTAEVLDFCGKPLKVVDDFVEELNMLRGEILKAKEALKVLENK